MKEDWTTFVIIRVLMVRSWWIADAVVEIDLMVSGICDSDPPFFFFFSALTSWRSRMKMRLPSSSRTTTSAWSVCSPHLSCYWSPARNSCATSSWSSIRWCMAAFSPFPCLWWSSCGGCCQFHAHPRHSGSQLLHTLRYRLHKWFCFSQFLFQYFFFWHYTGIEIEWQTASGCL